MAKEVSEKKSHRISAFRKKFGEVLSGALISALGLIVALSWNSFIIKLVQSGVNEELFQKYPYLNELITAIVITLIATVGILVISYIFKKDSK